MDARYKQLSVEDQLIEECSELIKALCKYKRFGAVAVDPNTKLVYDNRQDVLNEIEDVKQATMNLMIDWAKGEKK